MPELRKDPIVGRWVIIATDRARRPQDFKVDHAPPKTGMCPFCPGHEDKTPPEILAFRPHEGPGARPNTPGWSLRVFANKFPALMVEGNLDREGDGVYDRMRGVGAHEVLVETPDHSKTFCDLTEPEIEAVAPWQSQTSMSGSEDTNGLPRWTTIASGGICRPQAPPGVV